MGDRIFLDRWYDRYIELMFGSKQPADDIDNDDDVPLDQDVVVGPLIGT